MVQRSRWYCRQQQQLLHSSCCPLPLVSDCPQSQVRAGYRLNSGVARRSMTKISFEAGWSSLHFIFRYPFL
jgi:hypothetical protein